MTEKRGFWKLKEEAADRSVWRTRIGRGCGPAAGWIWSDVLFKAGDFLGRVCVQDCAAWI